MHFSWQNLNEKNGYRKRGEEATTGWPHHGRCWLRFNGRRNRSITLEWALLSKSCRIGFEICDEGWLFTAALPPLAFYLRLNGFKLLSWLTPKRLSTYLNPPVSLPDERECEVAIHNWSIWIHPWCKRMETNFSDPWWVRGVSFNIPDFIFGRTKHSRRVLDEFDISIPMPEANYPAHVKIEECVWKRPRWKGLVRTDATVDITQKGGIPFPGKGENSWDCGIDGLCGYGCSSTKPEDIIAEGVSTVLNRRRRYGGSIDWVPQGEETYA